MNANKATVAMLKAAGFEVVGGDKVSSEDCKMWTITRAGGWNSTSDGDEKWWIESLAPRENTGVQPVGDDCVVDILLKNGRKSTAKAGICKWHDNRNTFYRIESWTPNLSSILEQKMNVDKSALELTERDIEDAFIQQDDAAVEREMAESESEYDCGMRHAMQKIAQLVGRNFAVNVGYVDLPDVVEAALTKSGSDEWVNGLPPIGYEFHVDEEAKYDSHTWLFEEKIGWEHEDLIRVVYADEVLDFVVCLNCQHAVFTTAKLDADFFLTPDQLAAREVMAWNSYINTLSVSEVSEILFSKGLYAPDEYRK